MEKTNVAIAGLGGIAQIIHLPSLKQIKEVEISAVCDKDLSKARKISDKHNIGKYYQKVDEMLEKNPEIDAVIIAAATDAHKELSIKCLDAGKDIFVEKPIARNYSETKKIV